MYKIVAVCALIAAAQAGAIPGGYWSAPANQAAAQYGQGSGAQAGGYQVAAASGMDGAQGAQGSQGAQAFSVGGEHADASQASGRYDHSASILMANEHTSAAAEQSGGQYDAGYGFGGAQGAQGSQGSYANAGYVAGDEAGGFNAGQQSAGVQAAQQAPQQVVVQRVQPIAVPVQYQAPLAVGGAAYGAGVGGGFAGAAGVAGAGFGVGQGAGFGLGGGYYGNLVPVNTGSRIVGGYTGPVTGVLGLAAQHGGSFLGQGAGLSGVGVGNAGFGAGSANFGGARFVGTVGAPVGAYQGYQAFGPIPANWGLRPIQRGYF